MSLAFVTLVINLLLSVGWVIRQNCQLRSISTGLNYYSINLINKMVTSIHYHDYSSLTIAINWEHNITLKIGIRNCTTVSISSSAGRDGRIKWAQRRLLQGWMDYMSTASSAGRDERTRWAQCRLLAGMNGLNEHSVVCWQGWTD